MLTYRSLPGNDNDKRWFPYDIYHTISHIRYYNRLSKIFSQSNLDSLLIEPSLRGCHYFLTSQPPSFDSLAVLGIEPRTVYMIGKHSTNESRPTVLPRAISSQCFQQCPSSMPKLNFCGPE